MYLAQVSISDEFAPAEKFSSIADLVNIMSRWVALGGGLLVVAAFVYTAYLYMSSGGDTKTIEKSKMVITYAIIGLIVIAASYWITQIIAQFLGQNF